MQRRHHFAMWPMVGCASLFVLTVGVLAELSFADGPGGDIPLADFEPSEAFPGGESTAARRVHTINAFSHPSANMGFAKELDFKLGNAMFRKLWVTSPASTRSSDGLGPLYNARACQRCHLKDGRGHPPAANWPEDNAISMFLRVSIPPQNDADRKRLKSGRANVIPEPTYGTQLQDLAVKGHDGEGRMHITYREHTVVMTGGETVSLRTPTYRVTDLKYGPMHPQTMLSPRVAQPMIGLGLLEAIPATDILARADPDDADGDGISGRANRVWSVTQQAVVVGRFGWKAGNPTVLQQTAGAAAGDIGLGSYIFPRHAGDCTLNQRVCLDAPAGGSAANPNIEFKTQLLKLTAFYSRNLAVPPRRNPKSPNVLAGKYLFHSIGCASCHTPSFRTGSETPDPHLAGQRIWPYTDLLLHDMGAGLADNRPEGRATGREWRTAPLWGIGLTEIVSGHTFFLHDGRARSVTEAILWHGGEAKTARDAFAKLSPNERKRLLAFVNSL
ncbi:MAG: di-heme oxidoredictase family protein [Pseudomonadota bacterium]